MKILITGSKGFVGSHLTTRLKKNNEIVGYDLKEGRDVLNEDLLDKYLKGVDVVIHLAAFVDGNESWKKPETYLINNGLGTYKVIKCAIKNKVKRIDHAINGLKAVELASKNRYDLVLMDIKMPVMDGIKATIKLKQQFPDMPIIAQTAYSTPEERAQAMQAGCDDYISKPIKKADLMKIIGKVLA